jgi:glycosyltransferase involved in cell wall biosynthesis
VVDDASIDATSELLFQKYFEEISSGRLKIIRLDENRGVTAAKNTGDACANSDWVIFLDSDDEYLAGIGRQLVLELNNEPTAPIVFFRCKTVDGCLIGDSQGIRLSLDLKGYLKHSSHGEALTAINKKLVGSREPYVNELRGYEGIGCARLIRDFGHAVLSNLVARQYDVTGQDRLSSHDAFIRRMPLLAKGHRLMAKEFRNDLSWPQLIMFYVKVLTYSAVGNLYIKIRR